MRHEEIVFPEDADDPYRERRRLDEAIEQAKLQLEALQARLKGEGQPGQGCDLLPLTRSFWRTRASRRSP